MKTSITSWSDDDPRKKLLSKGCRFLTDAELLAILISTGKKHENAVALAKGILASVGNNLAEFGRLGVPNLLKFKGAGESKVSKILAALELGRRRNIAIPSKKEKIITSLDAFNLFKPILSDLPHEEFWVVLLNRSAFVIKKEMISRGGVSGTVVDAKIIFKVAVECLSSSIILFHNHPSGNLKPSDQDIQITKKIKEAGRLLEIQVLDHLIISENGYYSFAEGLSRES